MVNSLNKFIKHILKLVRLNNKGDRMSNSKSIDSYGRTETLKADKGNIIYDPETKKLYFDEDFYLEIKGLKENNSSNGVKINKGTVIQFSEESKIFYATLVDGRLDLRTGADPFIGTLQGNFVIAEIRKDEVYFPYTGMELTDSTGELRKAFNL